MKIAKRVLKFLAQRPVNIYRALTMIYIWAAEPPEGTTRKIRAHVQRLQDRVDRIS